MQHDEVHDLLLSTVPGVFMVSNVTHQKTKKANSLNRTRKGVNHLAVLPVLSK